MRCKMKTNYLILFIFLIAVDCLAQTNEKCKVLNEELIGTYIGSCSNGLANGKGEFKFANGTFIYVGNFKDGKIDGKGEIFSIVKNKRTSIKKGNWEDNVFVGDKSGPYQIKNSVNLDRYTVTKNSGGTNKVMINFIQNGSRNKVSQLSVTVNNGERIIGDYTDGYENIRFPFTCRINYTTQSKFKATNYNVSFEIEIYDAGSWEIFLYN